MFWRYFSAIVAFTVVMLLLLLTTKYLTYKSKRIQKGNYMQIIESLNLGVNNRIHLIKVDKEFFIISSSNKNTEFLAKVNISDYEEQDIKNPISEVIDFKAILKKYVNGVNFGKQTNNKNEAENLTNVVKETQNSDITLKNNLEKLKGLTKSINS